MLTLVNNERVSFFDLSPQAISGCSQTLSIEAFCAGHDSAKGRLKSGGMLIVPDFWLSIKPFEISTDSRSIVEAYVQRKLRLEHPDIPAADKFFDLVPYRSEDGRSGVYVYHFQEPLFFQFYACLEKAGLCPDHVTTPGLLWESKLKELIPDFSEGGVFLVDLAGAECFFYFFHKGRYLFSRDISISTQIGLADRLDALSFEIDQSRFLFSQKAKSDINRIFLVSAEDEEVSGAALSRRLGRETIELPQATYHVSSEFSEDLNALSHFAPADYAPAPGGINPLHCQRRKELEWRPVQTTGLVVGLLLLVLLIGQALFIQWWTPSEWFTVTAAEQLKQKKALKEYGSKLDAALQEVRRPSASELIVKVAKALPPALQVENLDIDLTRQQLITLEALVRAAGPDAFAATLAATTTGLESSLADKGTLTVDSLEFEALEGSADSSLNVYRIKGLFSLR